MTTSGEHGRVGMVVNSFAAVSLNPPLVLWSLRRESKSACAFTGASHFAVNILASTQVPIAQKFSVSSGDNFADLPHREGLGGSPLLDEAVAQFECRREALHDGGDHWIVVGRVERYARLVGDPLVFSQGSYAALTEHPGVTTAIPPNEAAKGEIRPHDTFLRLLFSSSHAASEAFEQERTAEGLTLSQARVLAWLYDRPMTIEELKRTIYLGARAAEDAVADLVRKCFVVQLEDRKLQLTREGRERRERIDTRVSRFEAKALEGIAPGDLASVRRVLIQIAQHTRGASPAP